jgi:hypothetical protein
VEGAAAPATDWLLTPCSSCENDALYPSGVQAWGQQKGVSPPMVLIPFASLRCSSLALAVAFDALTSAEEINFSCLLDSLSTLRAAATCFFSSATFCLSSLSDLQSAAIWVLVETLAPVRRGRGPGGGINGNALKPRQEQEVIVNGIAIASSRSSCRDAGCSDKPALLGQRGQLHIEEKRHDW